MKLKVLIENTACRSELAAEHGLSLLIDVGGRKILFDAGQSEAFAENAQKLNVDLSAVDLAILSHGHYDHGGGLRKFMELNRHAPIYVNRHAFGAFYSGKEKYIGLHPALMSSGRIIRMDDFCSLGGGLTLCTCNDQEALYPASGQGLSRRENEIDMPDDFRHEQYLIVEENGRRVLFSGCSHKGILNLMAWLHPDAVVGGFHSMKSDLQSEAERARLNRMAKLLAEYPTSYYTCHCTGQEQFAFLKEQMGDQLRYLSAGDELEL